MNAPLAAQIDEADLRSVEGRHSNTFLRLKKKLERQVGSAIADFNLIEDGDTVMVCL